MKAFSTHPHHLGRKQSGMIQGAILFGLAILAIVIGAFALANRSTPSNTSNESNKVNASTIIKIGNDFSDAVTRYGMDYDLAAMTLDQVAATGLYDPAKGIAPSPFIGPKDGTTTPSTAYTFETTGYIITGQGDDANSEFVVALSGVTTPVCQQIERILRNTPITDAIPTTLGGRVEGCVDDSGTNTYYKMVRAN